jgi:hypothetical protein
MSTITTSKLPITDARAAEPLTSKLPTTSRPQAASRGTLSPPLLTLDNRPYV